MEAHRSARLERSELAALEPFEAVAGPELAARRVGRDEVGSLLPAKRVHGPEEAERADRGRQQSASALSARQISDRGWATDPAISVR